MAFYGKNQILGKKKIDRAGEGQLFFGKFSRRYSLTTETFAFAAHTGLVGSKLVRSYSAVSKFCMCVCGYCVLP